MRILAIETSTTDSSIALLDEHAVVHETALRADQRTAQSLAPALDAAFQHVSWSPGSVELVAVTHGPGSFTGLRIAVTTAKTFAYATGAQLVALNTLRAVVEQLPPDVTDACAVMNAQRKQVFAARYRRVPGHPWTVSAPCRIVDQPALAGLLSSRTVLTGPALARWSAESLAGQPRAEPQCWTPRASTVGRLGLRVHRAGQRDSVLDLQPRYYRRSYAEEAQR
ncbi:MAG: tRNA (adenosine(37)-N6)-threonylcarbamoyltransferase complex dimerization subunit type 1 TsaB [Pirellulaceae bacterium]